MLLTNTASILIDPPTFLKGEQIDNFYVNLVQNFAEMN